MKIAMRVFVLMFVFSAVGFSQTSFQGPGTNPGLPPHATA
jgi:hypothetical protein